MSSGFLNLTSLPHPITPPTSSTFSLHPHSIQPYTLFLPPPSHLRLPAHLQPFSVQDNILPHPLATSFPSSPDPNFLPSSFQLLPPPLIQPQLPTLGIPGFSKPSLCPSLLFAEKPYQPRSCTEYHGSQQTGFPLTEFSHTPRASTTMTMPAVANPFTLSLTTNNSELFCSPLTTLHKGTETATKAIQFPAGVFFSNEYLDTVSSQEKMKLGGSDEDRGEEKGSCSSTKRMSMSPSQSVLVDKEGKNENYACGRKKRRRKKRRGEEYKNNCDSELEGSSLSSQVRTVKGKPRRVSSHVGTTSSATAQKREKNQKSVNRWSCASPQLQIAIMESNDNSSQRSRNGTTTMTDLASECKIRMSTSRKELYTDQPPTQNKNDSNLDSSDSCSKQYLSPDGQHLLDGFHCWEINQCKTNISIHSFCQLTMAPKQLSISSLIWHDASFIIYTGILHNIYIYMWNIYTLLQKNYTFFHLI